MKVLALNIQHAATRRVPLVAMAVLASAPPCIRWAVPSMPRAAGLGDVPVHRRDRVWPPIEGARIPLDGSAHAQRILEADIAGVTVAAVYFPLGRQHEPFWDGLFIPYADALVDRPAILAGDWNTGSQELDIGGGAVPGMTRFERLVAASWTDAWRSLHPEVREFSWYDRRSGNGFRIDHALLSPMLAPRLRKAEYVHSTRTSRATDHSGLLVELSDAGVEPSAGP